MAVYKKEHGWVTGMISEYLYGIRRRRLRAIAAAGGSATAGGSEDD